MIIYADVREDSSVVLELKNLGCEVERTALTCGDYVCSERVCVERKKTEDFVSSVIDGRLFSQLSFMKKNYERPILILEGPVFSERMKSPQMFGALASVLVDFSVPVFRSSSPRETAMLIRSVARREWLREPGKPNLRPEKPKDLAESQLFLVSGLPGVNSVLASRLLLRFRTPRAVFSAPEKDLTKVEGIGPKKAAEISKILDAEFPGKRFKNRCPEI